MTEDRRSDYAISLYHLCCPAGGDLLAGFGGISAVDSPQRTAANVSPGNPWDLSGLDPMAASHPLSAQVNRVKCWFLPICKGNCSWSLAGCWHVVFCVQYRYPIRYQHGIFAPVSSVPVPALEALNI